MTVQDVLDKMRPSDPVIITRKYDKPVGKGVNKIETDLYYAGIVAEVPYQYLNARVISLQISRVNALEISTDAYIYIAKNMTQKAEE